MKTNKTFKKIASTATAAILATCAIVPISVTNIYAAGTASIEITNSQAGHKYEAYQIFKGQLSGSTLSNIDWGTGIDSSKTTALLNEIKTISGFDTCANAADVADVLASKGTDEALVKQFSIIFGKYLSTTCTSSTATSSPYTISGLDDGYYLVKDKKDSLDGKNDSSYTEYIVQVLGNTSFEAKSDLPTFEKKVDDKNDTTNTSETLLDYADHDIGDEVPFTLKGTLPDNFNAYTTYKYTMHDTLAAGLTLTEDSIVVKLGDTALTKGTDYTVNTSTSDNHTFDIVFPDLKGVTGISASSEITVTYTAKLNDNAKFGTAGNPNTAYLEYSNNPYDDSDTSRTPDDTVIVYTYDVIVNKTDGNNNALPNAGFTLFKKEGSNWKEIKKIAASAATTFEFKGIDDGLYKLEESETPTGYNTIKPVYFEVVANHASGLTTLTATQQTEDGKTVEKNGFTATAADGLIKTTIQNKAGSTLPSTGGIGTTPFYVGGGVLVAAAGVYIIVKKRMKNNEDK